VPLPVPESAGNLALPGLIRDRFKGRGGRFGLFVGFENRIICQPARCISIVDYAESVGLSQGNSGRTEVALMQPYLMLSLRRFPLVSVPSAHNAPKPPETSCSPHRNVKLKGQVEEMRTDDERRDRRWVG
jgi:hypothetical protein